MTSLKETLANDRNDYEAALQTQINKLTVKAGAAQATLDQLNAQIEALTGAMNGFATAITQNGVKSKKLQKSWKEVKLSAERHAILEQWLRVQRGETVSSTDIKLALNWSDSAVNIAVRQFRDEGLLTLDYVGEKNNRHFYRFTPPQVALTYADLANTK